MAIRVGLIGAGRVGRAHLAALAAIPDVQVAAVCDTDRSKAEAAAQPFNAGAHINFRTLLEAERLDAVFISLPPFALGEPEMAAARAGIHLFVEPPVALNAEKARQIQKEVEKSGVVALVDYSWRYLSRLDEARAALKDRKVALVRGWRLGSAPPPGWRRKKESSGGLFFQEAADLVDLARYLCGDVTHASASQFEGIVAARTPDYDIEDACAATLRFRNGTTAGIVVADASPREDTGLAFTADNLEVRITPAAVEIEEPGKRVRLAHAGAALETAQKVFLDAVRTGHTTAVRSGYADAVRSLEVAIAVNESAQTGKVVNL